MSHATDARTALAANATIMAQLTGGAYTYSGTPASNGTGRLGINRDSTPNAYGSDTLLKPCALCKQRGEIPDGQVVDQALQVQSYRAVVEVWLYSDGGAAAPETAATLIIALFHERTVGSARFRLINKIEDFRDPEMERANVIRLDFEIAKVRR